MPGAHRVELPMGYRERLPRSWHPWLDQLPGQVERYLERWDLVAVGEFPLSYGYVVPVERADGSQGVLKLQPTDVPGVGGSEWELRGLRLGSPLTVEVLEEDAAGGVLLLERAIPGVTFEGAVEHNDDAATETLARVIRDYGRPLDDPQSLGLRAFEELAGAFERFDRNRCETRSKAVSDGLVSLISGADRSGSGIETLSPARDTAELVLADLLADETEPYLLHGDLHHGNVLVDADRGLVIVDPWGFYGDRAADVAPALHNPIDFVARTTDVGSLIRRRLSIYAEVLDIDLERLAAWSYVYTVIRTLWTLEAGGEVSARDPGMRTVAALRELI